MMSGSPDPLDRASCAVANEWHTFPHYLDRGHAQTSLGMPMLSAVAVSACERRFFQPKESKKARGVPYLNLSYTCRWSWGACTDIRSLVNPRFVK